MTGDDRWGQVPDDELVRRSRQGDQAAFGALVERHQAVVYRMALSMLNDADLAYDVTQDAFLRAFGVLVAQDDGAKLLFSLVNQ